MSEANKFLSATYFPNPEDAEKVRGLVRAGVESKAIADLINVTEKQLKQIYPYEMGYTDVVDLAVVANVAYQMATDGENPAMTKWWLTVKGGWMFKEGTKKEEPFKIILDQEGSVELDGAVEADFSEIRPEDHSLESDQSHPESEDTEEDFFPKGQ